MKKIINFSGHALSEKALDQLKEFFGETEIETIKVSLSRRSELFPQIVSLMEKIDWDNGEQPITILPGLPIANSLALAYIHGVAGVFPKVVELLRKHDSGVYEVSKIYDLEYLRHMSRRNR